MRNKKLLNLTGSVAPLSSSDENQLKGGFGTVGTTGIQLLGTNYYCKGDNENCSGDGDDDNDTCLVINSNCTCSSCSTAEPSTEEPTDDTTDDIVPTDDE